jgi:membrane protein required for colicin V production
MNILDVIFLLLAVFFLLRGLYRGLILEVSAFIGAGAGFFLANAYHRALTPYVSKAISNTGWAGTISYLLIFIAVIILFSLLASAAKKYLTLSFTKTLDRLTGSAVGLAKGLLICCVLLMVLSRYFPDARFLSQSRFAPYLEGPSEFLGDFLPNKTGAFLNSVTNSVKEAVEDTMK